MKIRIAVAVAAAVTGAAAWSVPASAITIANGSPCTVGQTSCVQDDGDDPTAGHIVNPTGTVTTTTYDGDTGEATTTTSPASTPSPTPAD